MSQTGTKSARRPLQPAIAPPAVPPRVLIIEARFYDDIADALADGAIAELDAQAAAWDRIAVPGCLEIPQAMNEAVRRDASYAGVVALGCVIRGETSHYDIVCNETNRWMMDVAIRHALPLGNGVLTVDTKEQALARARGGRDGKGGDAARACLRVLDLRRYFSDTQS